MNIELVYTKETRMKKIESIGGNYMLIRTHDEDGSLEKAKSLPAMSVRDIDYAWEWECACGYANEEDEVQEGGILICESCGRRYFVE